VQYKNEKQVKKALGIESLKNLSKDKVIEFAAMMPDMKKEVMLEIIKSYPEFIKYGNDLLNELHDTIVKTIEKNSSDYQASLGIIKETQLILKEQLNRTDISSEERIVLINNLMEIARMMPSMDKQNKKFLALLNNNALKATAAALGLGIFFVGGKVILNQLLGDESEEVDTDNTIDFDYEEI
jgi:hypothetical protein